jgi:hypothetical protein
MPINYTHAASKNKALLDRGFDGKSKQSIASQTVTGKRRWVLFEYTVE